MFDWLPRLFHRDNSSADASASVVNAEGDEAQVFRCWPPTGSPKLRHLFDGDEYCRRGCHTRNSHYAVPVEGVTG